MLTRQAAQQMLSELIAKDLADKLSQATDPVGVITQHAQEVLRSLHAYQGIADEHIERIEVQTDPLDPTHFSVRIPRVLLDLLTAVQTAPEDMPVED